MGKFFEKKIFLWITGVLLLWLGARYVLPVVLPFLLGAALAFSAEPVVDFCVRKGKLPRAAAAGVGITGVLVAVITLLSLLGAVMVREIGTLAKALPDLQQTARDGMGLLQTYLTKLASSAPDGIQPLLNGTVTRFFDDGTAVMDRVADRIPALVGSILGAVPDGALGIGTGLIAAFMISARLPKLREKLDLALPEKWKDSYIPTLRRVRKTLWGWLKAQLTLCLVTYGIITVGFLFMKIPYAPAWATLVAAVDAVPLLGTGTVLAPCALVSLMQGEGTRALCYLGLYGLSAGLRAVLEPKLVGKHLGLDPLVTLVAIYTGYRFWGFLGLILAPMAASAVAQILNAEKM